MSLGSMIRNARLHKGITQEELANAIGVKKAVISLYENDKRAPSLKSFELLAKHLDLAGFFPIAENDPVVFSERLAELRQQKGLSQAQLAQCMGVSAGTIGNYEAGTRQPRSFEQLEKIASFFSVSTDYLIGRNKEIEMSPEERNIITLFRKASADDKAIIKMILRKYDAPK